MSFSGTIRDEYGFVDPNLDRLDHILAHMSPDEFKDIHSVFPEQVKFRGKTYDLKNGDLFKFLDDLWAARNVEGSAVYKHSSRSANSSSVIYDFNVVVIDAYGQESSQFVRIATTGADDGTVLSAYPATSEDLQKAKTDPTFRRVNPKPKAQPVAGKDAKPAAGEIEMVPDAQRVILPPVDGPEPKIDTDQGEFVPKKDADEVVAQINKRNPSFAPAWDAKAALESKNTHQLQASADYYNDLIEKLPAGDARAAELIALRDKLVSAASALNTDPTALTKDNIDRILAGDNLLEIEGLQARLSAAKDYTQNADSKAAAQLSIDRCLARKEELSGRIPITTEYINSVIEGDNILLIQGLYKVLAQKKRYIPAGLPQAEIENYTNNIQLDLDRLLARRIELTGEFIPTQENIDKILAGADELEIQGLQSKLFNKKPQATPVELVQLEKNIKRCMDRKAELAGDIPLNKSNVDKILQSTDPFVIEGLERRLWSRKTYPEKTPSMNDIIHRCQARKAELVQVELTQEVITQTLKSEDLLVIDGLHLRLTGKRRGATGDRKAEIQFDIDRCIARRKELSGEADLTPDYINKNLESDNILVIEGLQKKLEFKKQKAQDADRLSIQDDIDRCIARKAKLAEKIPLTPETVDRILQGSNLIEITGLQEFLRMEKAKPSNSSSQNEFIDESLTRCSERKDQISGQIELTDSYISNALKTDNVLEIDGLYRKLLIIRKGHNSSTPEQKNAARIYMDQCQIRKYELMTASLIKATQVAIESGNRYNIEAVVKERWSIKSTLNKLKNNGNLSPELDLLRTKLIAQDAALSQARVGAQYAAFERSGYEDRQEARRILQEEFDTYKKSVDAGHIDPNSEEAKWMEDAYKEFEKNKAGNPGVKITRVRLDHLNHRLVSDLNEGVKAQNTKAVDNTLTRMAAEYEKLKKAVDASYKIKTQPPTKATKLPPAPRSGKPDAAGDYSPTASGGATATDPAYIFDGRLVTPDAIQELDRLLDNTSLTPLQRMRIEGLIKTIEEIQAKISEMLAIPYEKPKRPTPPPTDDMKPAPPVDDADPKKDVVRPVITREQLAQRVTESLFKLKNFKWMSESEKNAIRQLILDIHLKAGAKMSITSNGDALEKVTIITTSQAQKSDVQQILKDAKKPGSSDAFKGVLTIFGSNITVIKPNPTPTPAANTFPVDPVDALKAQVADLDAKSAQKYQAAEKAADTGDEEGFNRLLGEAETAKNQADALRMRLAELQNSKGSPSPSARPPFDGAADRFGTMVALSVGKDGALYDDKGNRVPFSGDIADEALWRGTGVNPLTVLSATSGITRIGERLGKEFGGDNLGNVEFTRNANGEEVYRFSVNGKIPQDKVAAALGLRWNAVMPLHRDDQGRIVYEVTSRDAARALRGAGVVTATRSGANNEQSVDASDVRQYLLDRGLDPDQFEVRQYGGMVRIVPKGQTDLSATQEDSGEDETRAVDSAPKPAPASSEFRIISTPVVQFTPENSWSAKQLAEAICNKGYASNSNKDVVEDSLIKLNGGRRQFAAGIPINIDPAVLVDSEGNTPSFERVIRSLELISEPLNAGRKLRNPLQTLFPKRFKSEYRAQVAMVTRRAEFVSIKPAPEPGSVSENKPNSGSTTITTLTDGDPVVALNKITTTLQPVVPDAPVKHSENGTAYVELDLRQASDVVRTQQASAKADKVASAAETAFTNTLSKNSNGVLGSTGTSEASELIKANDAFVKAKKDLDTARMNADVKGMQKAAEEMDAQAKYATQIAEQSQRKYGRRGKNLQRDMRIQAKKQQAAMAEAARRASIAPAPNSISAKIDTPHAYLAKRFGGAMNTSGWMMKIMAATNLLLLAAQISQARGRQEDAKAKQDWETVKAEQKVIDALDKQLYTQAAFMSVMTVLDVGLHFMEQWIPAGPARAIPPRGWERANTHASMG